MIHPPTQIEKSFVCWGLAVLLTSPVLAAEPAKGPSFPRIANVYGTAFTKDGTRFHGDDRTLEEAARYDLLVGVQRWQRNDPDGKVFRKHLEELKKINPHLIALHFACSAPYTHVAPPDRGPRRTTARPDRAMASANRRAANRRMARHLHAEHGGPRCRRLARAQTVPAVRQIGYDGVFIDCLGPHFDTWACEIATENPTPSTSMQTAKTTTAKNWRKSGRMPRPLWRTTRELVGAEAVFMANQAGPETFEHLNGIYLEDYIDAVLDRGMSWENVLEKYLHWTKTPQQPNVTVLGCGTRSTALRAIQALTRTQTILGSRQDPTPENAFWLGHNIDGRRLLQLRPAHAMARTVLVVSRVRRPSRLSHRTVPETNGRHMAPAV